MVPSSDHEAGTAAPVAVVTRFEQGDAVHGERHPVANRGKA